MDLEAELKQLKRRVDDLEGAVNVLAGQFRSVHPDVADLKLETMRRLDLAERQLDRIVSRLDTVNSQVWSLRDDLPTILRDALSGSSTKLGEPDL
jgi:hypothetical protein